MFHGIRTRQRIGRSGWLALVALGAAALPALAETITFEEFPAANCNCRFLTEEYADLGIHFVTTDDGSTWDGISRGDPGNWGLEGTNGPTFLGFNGASYALTCRFDDLVSDFRLDVARSNGSQDGVFILEGLRGGQVVESVRVTLGAINQWSTVQLSETVDGTRWLGQGSGFHPFGVDNVQWEPGGGACGERAKLKVKCKKGGTLVPAKLKKADPGIRVRFEIDGRESIDAMTNNNGVAKVKFTNQSQGAHEVTVCDLSARCGG